MEIVEKYFLIVSGAFDRDPVIYDSRPSEAEILEIIKDKGGKSARVEKRYIVKEQ